MQHIRRVLQRALSDEHGQDASRLHRPSQSNPGENEVSDGGLDNPAQSSPCPRPEELDAVRGSRDSQVIARSRENECGLTSQKEVKAPGGHRDGTGLSSGSQRAYTVGSTEAENLWTLSLAEHPSVIVDRHHLRTLSEWLAGAIQRNDQELDLAEDGSADGYRSACWRFASELRGHPLFAGANGSQVAKSLDKTINWSKLPDSDCYGAEMDPRDALIEAIEYQREHGIRPLHLALHPRDALELTELYPLSGPDPVGKYPRAVNLMYWYQLLLGQNGWFFLAVDTLKGLIGCSSKTSSTYMKRAVREGLIEIDKQYERHLRKATEYRWIGEVEVNTGEGPFDVS